MPDPLRTAAELLERSRLAYAVIGGHAVNAWLEPRFTADVDVTVVADPPALEALLLTFHSSGYQVEKQFGGEQPSGPDFVRVVSRDRDVIIELQVAKTAYQKEVVSRAVQGPGGARVATAEDLIVLKLIAFPSKDRVDLDGLMNLPGIDWSYVEGCCSLWDVAERLTEVRGRTA